MSFAKRLRRWALTSVDSRIDWDFVQGDFQGVPAIKKRVKRDSVNSRGCMGDGLKSIHESYAELLAN